MGIWKCLKCGTSTASANKPLVVGCPRGGNHRWSAYNSNKSVVWRCSKCGNSVLSANRPINRICGRGGNCSWQRQG
jgi:ABC-type ATPase with predicted acetyltransferase domain